MALELRRPRKKNLEKVKLLARNRRHGKPYPCSPRSFAQKGTNRSETWI